VDRKLEEEYWNVDAELPRKIPLGEGKENILPNAPVNLNSIQEELPSNESSLALIHKLSHKEIDALILMHKYYLADLESHKRKKVKLEFSGQMIHIDDDSEDFNEDYRESIDDDSGDMRDDYRGSDASIEFHHFQPEENEAFDD